MKHSLNEPGAYRWPHRPPKLIDYEAFMLPFQDAIDNRLANLLTDVRRHERRNHRTAELRSHLDRLRFANAHRAQLTPAQAVEAVSGLTRRAPSTDEARDRFQDLVDDRWRDYR